LVSSWDVILLEEVEHWCFTLDPDSMTAVTAAIDPLELEGPTLGRPKVDWFNGSKIRSMKELRPAGTGLRILFIFDARRQAILLLGGRQRRELEELVRQEHSDRRTAIRELASDHAGR
jgi:hypothetical protein